MTFEIGKEYVAKNEVPTSFGINEFYFVVTALDSANIGVVWWTEDVRRKEWSGPLSRWDDGYWIFSPLTKLKRALR